MPAELGLSFHDDGAAALEWAAAYLERWREFPVLAQVEPGEIRSRLPRRRPRRPSLSAAARPRREDPDGVTHWQRPRYFAYFPNTASEPGIVAELLIAALNQVGILWRTSAVLRGARGARTTG